MQPRANGPLTADKTSYGSYRADRVLGSRHAQIVTEPTKEAAKSCHRQSLARQTRLRVTGNRSVDDASGCG